MRKGRKSASQTPAPLKDRIYGSDKNKVGSASSEKSAKNISLSVDILVALTKKLKEFKKENPNSKNITLNDLKAVYRRGLGAYSSSHRPTITGGVPNTRNAWAMARVNKFLKKASGEKVKKAYLQDDDLMKYAEGGLIAPNGKKSNLTPEQYKLVRTPEFKAWFGDWENDPENASKVVDENGEPLVVYHGTTKDFNVFKIADKYRSEWKIRDYGVYFSNSEFTAKEYSLDYEYRTDEYQEWENKLEQYKKQQDWESWKKLYVEKKDQFSKNYSKAYKSIRVIKCFLNIRNAFIIEGNGNYWYKVLKGATDIAIDNKNDGIIALNIIEVFQDVQNTYVVFNPNQIKLADGTNTTFDNNNPDIRYNMGGNLNNNIMLPELNMTFDSLKETLNNQGYTIEQKKYNDVKINNNMFETLGKLFRPQNINYIAKEQNVSEEYARMQLAKGIEHEFEHTNDYETAKTIALHHLAENINYYIMLEKAENQVKDKNYDDHFKQVYAQGGSINFAFQTPTGKPTKLTYLQQVLVRTSSFKKWFGDWEKSAKEYIITDDFEKSFSGVSKCLDMETLEPRVVFHGTRTNEEFFVFNANMKGGRPYGYFAVNEQYSENFTTSSQTGLGNNPYLYRVFLSVKNPFKAIGHSFDTKVKNAEYWKTIIAGQIQWQKTKSLEKDERLTKAVESQIGRFVDEICSTGDVPFWMFMSRDVNSIFKRFLMSWGFDSVEFSENIRENFDVNNPSEFTYAYTIFDAPQVKLADGRNVEFNMQSDDMRYENGGNLNDEDMNKYEHLKSVIGGEGYHAEPIYKSGGSVQSRGNNKKDDATKGGYFVGRPHSQGGIKAINISTNSPIEVEGGEVIITKPAVEDNKKRMFEGEMLTNREILSKINQSGGGVPIFEEGGMCGCSGKKYNFGGNVVEDFRGIYDYMVKPYIVEPISETMQYVDSLIIKRKK